jgi:hypothetical protein
VRQGQVVHHQVDQFDRQPGGHEARLWVPRLARDGVPGRHQQQRLGLGLQLYAPHAKPNTSTIMHAAMTIQLDSVRAYLWKVLYEGTKPSARRPSLEVCHGAERRQHTRQPLGLSRLLVPHAHHLPLTGIFLEGHRLRRRHAREEQLGTEGLQGQANVSLG